MTVVKKTKEYTITQRRDKRYAVVGANKKQINGDEKAKILLAEKLIKKIKAKPAPVEEKKEEATEEKAAE